GLAGGVARLGRLIARLRLGAARRASGLGLHLRGAAGAAALRGVLHLALLAGAALLVRAGVTGRGVGLAVVLLRLAAWGARRRRAARPRVRALGWLRLVGHARRRLA